MSVTAGSTVRFLCLAAVVLSRWPSGSASATAPTAAPVVPERATVFLRVFGDIRPGREQDAWLLKEAGLERANVEVGAGTGFLFSPLGYILTNHHVVSDRRLSLTVDRQRVELSIAVRRVEVLFAQDASTGGPAPQEAAVVASSADLDLAVLHVGGSSDYPALPFGDSDALDPGQPVQVLGFPFGRQVELGKPVHDAATAPQVSVSQGTVSAIRDDAQGQPRFIQTTATLNPGNSGGPMIDADGYVTGVINSALVLREAPTGVGFAIPVNVVKTFLEGHGLEGQLPTRRLSLGPIQSLEHKGLRLRLPDGMSDVSPHRTAVDGRASSTPDLVLRVDRLVSTWSAQRLAEVLTSGPAFESLVLSATTIHPARAVADADARPPVRGRSIGTLADGRTPARMEFAIVDLGREKLVARYVGHPDLVAFNASILRGSLVSLVGELLATERPNPAVPRAWVPAGAPGHAEGAGERVPVPQGWWQDAIAPLPCAGLARPAEVLSVSPLSDFTLAMRTGRLRQAGLTPATAAAACGTRAQTDDVAQYQRRVEGFGVAYVVRGAFIEAGANELRQLEVIAPAEQAGTVGILLTEWVGRVRGR